jgi:hypothetical protein
VPESPKKRCFVIGPIGAEDSENRTHADWLYSGIIQPVFAEHFTDFIVERADKIPTPGMVSSQIINRLYEVELVIADLSFHNANAFYEMAIRHNVGKPIIHMIRKNEAIPFDVIPHRAIPFLVARAGDLDEAKGKLLPAISEAIRPDFKPDNPIMHALGQLQLQKTASPELKVITDDLAAMRSLVLELMNQVQIDRQFRVATPTMGGLLGIELTGPTGPTRFGGGLGILNDTPTPAPRRPK